MLNSYWSWAFVLSLVILCRPLWALSAYIYIEHSQSNEKNIRGDSYYYWSRYRREREKSSCVQQKKNYKNCFNVVFYGFFGTRGDFIVFQRTRTRLEDKHDNEWVDTRSSLSDEEKTKKKQRRSIIEELIWLCGQQQQYSLQLNDDDE